MIKTILRNIDTVLAAISFFVTLYFFYEKKIDAQVFFGILASIITIYFGILKYRIENDKVFKELFETFNSKYDGKLNDLFNELRRGTKKELNEEDKNITIDYFNLCAEEFLWFKKGRIPSAVWEAWESGIRENLKLEKIKELYCEEIKTEDGRKSFYGLANKLRIKCELPNTK